MDLPFYPEWIMAQHYWGTDNRETKETQEQWNTNIQGGPNVQNPFKSLGLIIKVYLNLSKVYLEL